MSMKSWLKKRMPMTSRSANAKFKEVDSQFEELKTWEDKKLKSVKRTVGTEMDAVRSDVRTEIEGVRSDFRAEMEGVRSDLQKTLESSNTAYLQELKNSNDSIFDEIKEINSSLTALIKASDAELTQRLNNLDSEQMKKIDSANEKLLKRLSDMEKRIQTLESNEQFLRKLMYNHLDPELYAHAIKMWYQDKTGDILDLENPRTYNEKIQWMKVYDRDPIKTRLADKYLVRDWVKEKIGEEYLIPLLAVYHHAEDIDFDSLPDAFVLKANHGSAMNYIVRNKQDENLEAIRSRARFWLQKNFTFSNGYELQYNDIPRRLIVEEYLENADGDLPDYKFWCFDGKCKFIYVVVNRKINLQMSFFSPEWEKLPFTFGNYPPIDHDLPMPEKLPEMLRIAETLAQGFPHVRVDLYLLDDDEIKFGEMTFTSFSGDILWNPPEADLWVGEMFHLPEITGNQHR